MADSQQKIDWNEVRSAALDCLNATWDMVGWTERSQEDDYDVDCAALHLAAIDTARDTFRRAMEVLQPGFERATDDSNRYSPVFDALALATVGEGARPDFRFGPVHCATAHETAFELVRRGVLWVEDGVFEDMDERWFKDEKEVTIGVLHKLPLPALRDTLAGWGKRRPLAKLLDARGLKALRTWIQREWAAVGQKPVNTIPVVLTPEEITILEVLAKESPMTVTKEDLAGQTRLSVKTVRKYVGELRERGLVDQPRGPKKGFAIMPAGLTVNDQLETHWSFQSLVRTASQLSPVFGLSRWSRSRSSKSRLSSSDRCDDSSATLSQIDIASWIRSSTGSARISGGRSAVDIAKLSRKQFDDLGILIDSQRPCNHRAIRGDLCNLS